MMAITFRYSLRILLRRRRSGVAGAGSRRRGRICHDELIKQSVCQNGTLISINDVNTQHPDQYHRLYFLQAQCSNWIPFNYIPQAELTY